MTKNLFKYTLLSIFALSIFATSNTAFAAAPSCRLTADAGDTLVSFNVTGPLMSNAQPNQAAVNTSVPVGKYNLSAETWDDHAAHGGQNQQLEKVIFIGYDANNAEIFRTGATTDIAENANWAVTNLSQNLNLTSEVKKIVAKHNHIGAGGYQSIYPVCIKFDKVADVIPDPTLNASCVANPASVNLNQNVNWKVTPTGGNNSYTYVWSGTDSLSGTTQELNKSYSTVGAKTASVVVKSGTQEKTVSCSTNVTTTPVPPPTSDLVASCSVSDTSVETDESVTFSSNVTGGKGPYTYKWTGDISSTNSSKTESFDDEGRYRAYLEVRDSENRVANATCSTVNVDDDNDDDDLEISCEVSDTRIEEGEYVTFEVEIDGGNSPYEIEWDGDISGDDERERVRFNKSGRYEVEVTVEDDDGNRESDTCSTVRVDDDEDDDDDNNVTVIGRTNTPNGNLASVDSVFLSSLPYTGPADTAKTLGFISLLILWSAIITKLLLTKKQKKDISSRIQAFKEANKANKTA